MGRKRSTGNKPYKIRQHKDRPIDVEFDIMPGKRISTGCYTIPQAIDFAENYLKTESFSILNPKEPTLHQFSKNFFWLYSIIKGYKEFYPFRISFSY